MGSRRTIKLQINDTWKGPHSSLKTTCHLPKLHRKKREQSPIHAERLSPIRWRLEHCWWEALSWLSLPACKACLRICRLDLYESGGVFQTHLAALETPKSFWTPFQRYNIRSCLILKGSVQARLLDSSPQWEEIYRDHMSVVFIKTRKSGGPAGEPSALSWMPGPRRYFV